jgi:DNA-binding GntR family transcriptional regulator
VNDNEDSTVEKVIAYIRKRIINGDFLPGSKIEPKKIADACKSSLIPVREALRVLQTDGLVTVFHYKGTWVARMSLADLRDLYSVRIQLESESVRMAQDVGSMVIAKLRDILHRTELATKVQNKESLFRLNKEFHYEIYQHCRSPWRLRLIDTLWDHAERYQRLSIYYRDDAAAAEHLAIVDALERGDLDAAGRAMAQHLESTVDLLEDSLEGATCLDDEWEQMQASRAGRPPG